MPSDSLGPWSLAMPPPGPPVKVPRKTVLLLPLLMAKCSGSAGGLQSALMLYSAILLGTDLTADKYIQ
jgi:hypothetical protein